MTYSMLGTRVWLPVTFACLVLIAPVALSAIFVARAYGWASGVFAGAVVLSAYCLLVFVRIRHPGSASPAEYEPVVTGPELPGSAWLDPSEEFGPNGIQVARFLARLPLLTEQHWESVRRAQSFGELSIAQAVVSYMRLRKAIQRCAEFEVRQPRGDALVVAQRLIQSMSSDLRMPGASPPAALQTTVFEGLCAIVYRDLLPPKTFDVLYAAFDHVIPAASLSESQS